MPPGEATTNDRSGAREPMASRARMIQREWKNGIKAGQGAVMKVITDTDELRDLCSRLAREEYITVDTEFMREHTFWPKLCLIQVAGEEEAAIIDPLARDMDLSPFFDLLADEKVLKVFHAGRQDIEIFHHLTGQVPRPVFDTQIAAMVCGFGDQVGYEALVRKLVGVEIDKGSRFTDWSRRPLSERQLQYALADVTHLRKVYERLREELERTGRMEWLAEELQTLTSPQTYEQNVEQAWRRLKFRPRNRRQLALLKRLAEWREREAQRRDMPRRRVMKDEAIAEIASEMPETERDLKRLRGISEGHAKGATGRAILRLVREVKNLAEHELPAPERRPRPHPEGTQARADILKLALKIVTEQKGIAPKIIASAADLERLAAGDTDVPAMRGWRREVFGELAEALLRGEKVIGLKDGRPAILDAPKPEGA